MTLIMYFPMQISHWGWQNIFQISTSITAIRDLQFACTKWLAYGYCGNVLLLVQAMQGHVSFNHQIPPCLSNTSLPHIRHAKPHTHRGSDWCQSRMFPISIIRNNWQMALKDWFQAPIHDSRGLYWWQELENSRTEPDIPSITLFTLNHDNADRQ